MANEVVKQQNEVSVNNENNSSTDFNTMQRVAKLLSCSTLVPTAYQAKCSGQETAIANCFIAIDMANRLHANPFMVMQNLYIVNGRPSLGSSFMIGLVNTCGTYEPLRFTISGEGDNLSCYAYTTEKGKDEVLKGTTITMQMADIEGWTKKDKWKSMPEQMIKYRAAAFWVRTYCPELIVGLYTEDEAEDIDFEEVEKEQKQNSKVIKMPTDEPVAKKEQTTETTTPKVEVKQTAKVDELAFEE